LTPRSNETKAKQRRARSKASALVGSLVVAAASPGCQGSDNNVGKILRVENPSVFAGTTEANPGDGLSPRTELRTNETGGVKFRIDGGAECHTKENSRLGIEPDEKHLIWFYGGQSFCSTSADSGTRPYGAGTDLQFIPRGTVFTVAVDETETVIGVTHGFVEIESETTAAEPVMVGPAQQAVSSAVQKAPRVEALKLTPEAKALTDGMERRLPRANTRPKDLERIAPSGALVFGLDASMPAAVESFVHNFARWLAREWDIDTRVEPLASKRAEQLLAAGSVQIVVERAHDSPTGTTIPLFTSDQTTWVMVIAPSSAFERSLNNVLNAALKDGDFAELYRNAFGSEPSYARSRRGVVAEVTTPELTPSAVDFGETSIGAYENKSLTLTAGSKTLTISSISTDAREFMVEHDCEGVLSAGATCTIQVRFAPASVGRSIGALTVGHPDGEALQTTLAGTGSESEKTAFAPAAMDFGHVDVGAEASRSLTLTAGSRDVTIRSITPSSPSFGASNNCPHTLGARRSCAVVVTFKPVATGEQSAQLEIDPDGQDPPHADLSGVGVAPPTLKPSRITFGSVLLGRSERRNVLLAAGTMPLTITNVSTGNMIEFSARHTCRAQIPLGTTCPITITFAPRRIGTREAVLVVRVANGPPLKVRIAGQGTRAALRVQPRTLEFGSVSYDPPTSRTETVTVTNLGATPITIENIEPSDPQYALTDDDCPSSLGGSKSCTFSVTFTPGSAGRHPGVVTITTDRRGQLSLPLSGFGVIG
jgi:Abnormal spindle-like microcephaly-assoc'd, ASPM-SPD-2-Hydin